MRRHVTFANVIALLALFISLSGGVYAASKINGAKIKKTSIAGDRLKPDTLTGTQVDESSLGTVPTAQSANSATTAESAKTADSAKTAETAATAASAQTLAGSAPGAFVSSSDVRRLRWDLTSSSGTPVTEPVLELGPLRVAGTCSPGSINMTVSTTAQNGAFDYGHFDNFDNTNVSGGGLGATPLSFFSGGNQAEVRGIGTLVYNDPTVTITIPFVAYFRSTPPSYRCFFTGTATRSSG